MVYMELLCITNCGFSRLMDEQPWCQLLDRKNYFSGGELVEGKVTDGKNERERARYTASQIADLVRAGKLYGLPTDTSAIHKLARTERWDFIKQKVKGQRGSEPHFYRVPSRYFEAASAAVQTGKRRGRKAAPPPSACTDEIRLMHLTAAETIAKHLPGLITRDRKRFTMIYLLVCRLLEKGNTDEKFIIQTMLEMAQIGTSSIGNNPQDEPE